MRTTRSVCPICYRELEAKILCTEKEVILEKKCLEHGIFYVTLSSNPQYFSELSKAYFSLMPEDMPCRILDLTLTPKCGLNCPICCVADSISKAAEPMTIEDVKIIVKQNPEKKEFFLGHMEPTENPQIAEIINFLRENGKRVYLFTNGLKFTEFTFLKELKKAGLSYVYLQFDGFSDAVYKILRGRTLLKDKLLVLDNLKRLNIPTTLNVTLAVGINEDEINKIINYSISNSFVRQIGILPLIRLGKADNYKKDIAPQCHESLMILQNVTNGKINLNNLRIFQKIMYVVYRFNKFRRCFWFNIFVLIRDEKDKSYKTLDELIDFAYVDKLINQYIEDIKNGPNIISDFKLIFKLAKVFVNFRALSLIFAYLKFYLTGKRLISSRSSRNILFITCTDFCDFYKLDLDMSDKYCEELLAIKNGRNQIVYAPTYKIIIEECRKNVQI